MAQWRIAVVGIHQYNAKVSSNVWGSNVSHLLSTTPWHSVQCLRIVQQCLELQGGSTSCFKTSLLPTYFLAFINAVWASTVVARINWLSHGDNSYVVQIHQTDAKSFLSSAAQYDASNSAQQKIMLPQLPLNLVACPTFSSPVIMTLPQLCSAENDSSWTP